MHSFDEQDVFSLCFLQICLRGERQGPEAFDPGRIDAIFPKHCKADLLVVKIGILPFGIHLYNPLLMALALRLGG